jgi:hypothetical protein
VVFHCPKMSHQLICFYLWANLFCHLNWQAFVDDRNWSKGSRSGNLCVIWLSMLKFLDAWQCSAKILGVREVECGGQQDVVAHQIEHDAFIWLIVWWQL